MLQRRGRAGAVPLKMNAKSGVARPGSKPQSLHELRELVLLIRRDESDISLGAKALEVLSKLVDAPEQTAVRTISELGEQLSVNASTLTRLAKRLGFSGFNDFQDVFREAIADETGYFYSRQAGRLLSATQSSNEDIA